MRAILALVALLVAALAMFAGCGDAEEQAPLSTATPAVTVASTATPTPVPATETPGGPSPTVSVEIYRNAKYTYEVALPPGWRLAATYMQRFADRITNPRFTAVPDDYAVLTSLSPEEEQAAVDAASSTVALGLEPWLRFGEGRAVGILPIDILYPGVSVEVFLKDVNTAGILRTNYDVRQDTLNTGEIVTRLTRREVDDNGDLTYDLVVVPAGVVGEKTILIRTVKASGYDSQGFETVFRSLRRG